LRIEELLKRLTRIILCALFAAGILKAGDIALSQKNFHDFLYIAHVRGAEIQPVFRSALPNLVRAINIYTGIKTRFKKRVYLSDRRIIDIPFLYIATDKPFELTKSEIENLRKYIESGGFIFADNGDPDVEDYTPSEASFHKMFMDILGPKTQPKHIPKDHLLYKTFSEYDYGKLFDNGRTGVRLPGRHLTAPSAKTDPVKYLEGYYIGDRMVGIYCDRGFGDIWQLRLNNEPQLKMGVNLIMYIIMQKGSIYEKKLSTGRLK